MAVDIRRIEIRAGQGQVDGKLSITKPLSNPFFEAVLHGQIDLAELDQATGRRVVQVVAALGQSRRCFADQPPH